jgi:Skp family chaperone for outer membrane proteins
LDAVVLTALAKDPAQRYQRAIELQAALERVLAGDAVAAGPGQPAAAAVPTEPLPNLPARTAALPATTGPAGRISSRRPGWGRWALAVAGLALGIGLVAWLWPDDANTPARREAGSTAAPATGSSSTTIPGSTATPAPTASDVDAALANLTAVITAARQQGTVDQQVEELLHQADDLAKALQENPKDKDDKDKGGGKRKGEDAAKKMAELERKVDELIGQGKIRPPATTQIQQAVAQLAQAVQQAS